MKTEDIFGMAIFLFVAVIMVGIGIVQVKSKKPVGFYSGEEPPKPEELTDVHAWNVRHGIMWLLYGLAIMVAWFAGWLIGDNIFCLIPLVAGLVAPIFVMIAYHRSLIKRYRK